MTDVGGAGIIWTPAREELRALLHDLHADAADLYAQAVEALGGAPLSRPRLMIGSHCVRELVPTLLEVQQIVKPPRANDSRAAKELSVAWTAYGLRMEPEVDEANYVDGDLRPLPHGVYVAARVTAAAGTQGGQNARVITALLALGQESNINTAPLRRLHKTIQQFTSWSHRRDYSKPLGTLPTVDEVEAQLRVIEEALLTRFANRADRVSALREQLRRANHRGEQV
ncbi:MAG: hypothetical protein ACR2LX_05525 [Jatrophihabitans sp.]